MLLGPACLGPEWAFGMLRNHRSASFGMGVRLEPVHAIGNEKRENLTVVRHMEHRVRRPGEDTDPMVGIDGVLSTLDGDDEATRPHGHQPVELRVDVRRKHLSRPLVDHQEVVVIGSNLGEA